MEDKKINTPRQKKEKIRFRDLSGWLKFGAIVSITFGIGYTIYLVMALFLNSIPV